MDRAKDSAESVRHTVGDKAQHVSERAGELTHELQERAGELKARPGSAPATLAGALSG